MRKTLKVSKIALALIAAGLSIGLAQAALTGSTATIKGTAPELISPGTLKHQAMDFKYTPPANTAPDVLAVGGTVTMTYKYDDVDGDSDASEKTVRWFYTKGGNEFPITADSVKPADDVGAEGSSVMTIPIDAVDGTIGVEIKESSLTGDPKQGHVLKVANIANNVTDVDGGTGGGGDGNTDVPVGPVHPNATNLVAGIYASDDTSYSTNLIGAATHLEVGKRYVFKLWLDANGDGKPDGNAQADDYTGKFTYNWRLTGTSPTDKVSAPDGGFVTSVNNADFTVPVNGASDGKQLTGSEDGAQGFGLAVDFNNIAGAKMSFMVNGKSVDTTGKAQGQ